MKKSTILFLFLNLYQLLWWLVLPVLRINARLREGIKERTSSDHLEKADIWIQGASAGECYLAATLVKKLCCQHSGTCFPKNGINFHYSDKPTKILLTSTTSQGIEVLSQNLCEFPFEIISSDNTPFDSTQQKRYSGNRPINLSLSPASLIQHKCRNSSINITWFPFDIPELMDRALSRIKPALIILLETELWPSLMIAAKKYGIKVVLINGRISERSFRNYLKIRWLWKMISPDKVLAISKADAERFMQIFPFANIDVMPNIKFDTISPVTWLPDNYNLKKSRYCHTEKATNPLSYDEIDNDNIFLMNLLHSLSSTGSAFSILASVRKEEEADILIILNQILEKFPNQVVGLFPRHMHRISFWKKTLAATDHRWVLRSGIEHSTPLPGTDSSVNMARSSLTGVNPSVLNRTTSISPGTVILWDIFGELKSAYSIATVAFVGGSLKPLGGQNFMEPLTSGAATVTGPFVEDFAWVGEDIFTDNIVKKASNKNGVIQFMVSTLENPPDRKDIIKQGLGYVQTKQGGTAMACNTINHYMSTYG